MEENSSTHFIFFTEKLRKALSGHLPGEVAQMKLAPLSRKKMMAQGATNRKARQSAVLIVLFPEENQVKTVLIKRNSYDGVHSGQIAFPGGGYEPGDADLQHTALREAYEEVGIKTDQVKILGNLSKIYIPPSNFEVLPVVAYMNRAQELHPDPAEVDTVFSCSVQTLMHPQTLQQRSIVLKDGSSMDVPAFVIGEYVIWGATSMIISELNHVIAESEALNP
ncbi:MAG: CoA pyrophosphatase [Bacteroidales bacterium]|nr:CoA pyrophosphatase [Bacteroidales bacterium]